MFANYDAKGGEPGRDHRWTTLVKFDDQWRRVGAWALPAAVLERMAPYSCSGGGFGDDGLLYVTGHDRPELYALAVPTEGGATLDLVATLAIPFEGQAIAWDRGGRSPREAHAVGRQPRHPTGGGGPGSAGSGRFGPKIAVRALRRRIKVARRRRLARAGASRRVPRKN